MQRIQNKALAPAIPERNNRITRPRRSQTCECNPESGPAHFFNYEAPFLVRLNMELNLTFILTVYGDSPGKFF